MGGRRGRTLSKNGPSMIENMGNEKVFSSRSLQAGDKYLLSPLANPISPRGASEIRTLGEPPKIAHIDHLTAVALNQVDFTLYLSLQRTNGKVWRYFGLSQLERTNGIYWVKAKDPARHHEVHRTAPDNNDLAPNASSTATKNSALCFLACICPSYLSEPPARFSPILCPQQSTKSLLKHLRNLKWKMKKAKDNF